MVLRNSKHGKFYGCIKFPKCDATHSAHEATGKPLGIPAGKDTKKWRVNAHKAFDKLWDGPAATMTRDEAYAWMRSRMHLNAETGHIGRFDVSQCRRLIALVAVSAPPKHP